MSFDIQRQIADLTKRATQYLQAGSLSFSLSLLMQAEELASPSYVPRYLKIMTFFAFANYLQATGNHKKSLIYFYRILNITQDKYALFKVHSAIASTFSLLGKQFKSLIHNKKALILLQDTGEYEAVASLYHAIGLNFQYLNQISKALAAYKKGLMISQLNLGVKHKLTKILRNCYLESTKKIKLVGFKIQSSSRTGNSELVRLVNELESPQPKHFTPLPPKLSSKKYTSLPKNRDKASLFRSVQYGTEDSSLYQTLISTETETKTCSTSYNKYRIDRSMEIEHTLFPVADKHKILFNEKRVFMIPKGKKEEKAATLIQKHFRKWLLQKSYEKLKLAVKNLRTLFIRNGFLLLKKQTFIIQNPFKRFRLRKPYGLLHAL